MKTRAFALLLIFLGFSQAIFSQVTDTENQIKKLNTDTVRGWKKGGVIGLNIAQASLTNWAAGGENSLAINGLFSVFANYKKGKISWDNSLDVGYGLLKQGSVKEFRKTDDKFDFTSKLGREAFKNVYYAALLNFKTQMSPGYNYKNDTTKEKISDLLSPAYITLALGLDYKPNAYLSIFLAPVTGRMTIVNDQTLADAGAFGVKKATYDTEYTLIKHGEKTRTEFGGYLRVSFTKNNFKNEFLKNVAFTTKIDLFSNYLENPQNIDVNWEVQLAFKVNKFIAVNFNTQLIYDDNIKIHYDKNNDSRFGPKVQFKEILGVGLSYNL
jgi:hypothetical protein